MFHIKQCLVYLYTVIVGMESAKILLCFPSTSHSHQLVFRAINKELLNRGHNLTVITTRPMHLKMGIYDNLTEIDVHHVTHKIYKKFLSTITGKTSEVSNEIVIGQEVITTIFEKVLELREIKNLIKYQKDDFDLLILEAVYLPFLGLTHIFKLPTILVSSFGSYPGNYEMVGAPTHPTLYSNLYSHRIYNLTIWDKVTEILNYVQIKRTIDNSEEKTNEILKKVFGPEVPQLKDLKNNVDMLFLNTYPIWNSNHPVPPSVIYMGGIHQTPPKKLPQDLQHYLDTSSNGVIYFSLGTNVNTSMLPMKSIEIFRNVFSQLPYNIIWKLDSDEFLVKSKNIKMIRWLPQADVLRHKNIKMFITQGGLQSTDEAITAGVPLIGVPMWADQWLNVEKCVYHKIGIRVDFDTLTEEKLTNAIIEIAKTESYRRNIVQLRSRMLDQPQSSLERTIWWIEYVLRHGGAKHLRAPAANMSWVEFLELELLGLVIFLILTSMVVVFVLVRFFISRVVRSFLSKIKLKKT